MYRLTIILLTVLLLAVSNNAYAQNNTSFKSGFKPKSETNAFLWSLSGTVVPIYLGASQENEIGLFLFIGGVFIGPSLGYFYGDIPKRGLRGFAVRGGVMLGSLMIGSAMGLETCVFGNSERNDDGWAVVGLGALFVVGHSIYDIIAVPFAVREHNRSLQSASMTLLPKYFADFGAGGLELKVTF